MTQEITIEPTDSPTDAADVFAMLLRKMGLRVDKTPNGAETKYTIRSGSKSLGELCGPPPRTTLDAVARPLLVACFTEPQLQIFCRNHQLSPRDVVRIRTGQQLVGRRVGTILCLPKWWEGTDREFAEVVAYRKWKTLEVTEKQVLEGTFQLAEINA